MIIYLVYVHTSTSRGVLKGEGRLTTSYDRLLMSGICFIPSAEVRRFHFDSMVANSQNKCGASGIRGALACMWIIASTHD